MRPRPACSGMIRPTWPDSASAISIEPGARDAWQQLWRALFDHPAAPGRGTFLVRHKDGGLRWIEAVARNLLQERRVGWIVIYFRDVTDRKATEEALKASEDRYGHLFYSAADIIFEADAEGYFRFVNPQTLRVFEYAADEVIGRRFTEFIRRRLPAADPPPLLQADHRRTAELVHRVPGDHQDGSRSVARSERLADHRCVRNVRGYAGGGARHHRAPQHRGSAPRRRSQVPRPRRAVADGRVYPAERAARLSQSESGRAARLYRSRRCSTRRMRSPLSTSRTARW